MKTSRTPPPTEAHPVSRPRARFADGAGAVRRGPSRRARAVRALALAAAALAAGAAAAQQTVLTATPQPWNALSDLADATTHPLARERRTLTIGLDGDIAVTRPLAQGEAVSLENLRAAAASDRALADAASLPETALRNLNPPPPEGETGLRVAALQAADASTRTALKGALPEATFDRDLAELIGVAFMEGADRMADPSAEEELACLSEAIYFEARGEPVLGQAAVAEVVLNRVEARYWPNSVCAVVNQGAERRNACQFSYICDGKPERVTDDNAWSQAERVAQLYMRGAPRRLTGHATHYHADYVAPRWARSMEETLSVGRHVFYRRLLRFTGPAAEEAKEAPAKTDPTDGAPPVPEEEASSRATSIAAATTDGSTD